MPGHLRPCHKKALLPSAIPPRRELVVTRHHKVGQWDELLLKIAPADSAPDPCLPEEPSGKWGDIHIQRA